jgi:hypothetical protein
MPTSVANVRGLSQADLESQGIIYVGRKMPRDKRPSIRAGSAFGNPFRGAGALTKYREHLLRSPELLALLPGLRGRCLGCWCTTDCGGEPEEAFVCHAQTLAALADGPLGDPR